MVKHILIADDDEDDRMLFSDALKQVAGDVSLLMAGDGIELLALLRETRPLPDLLFLDLNMPKRNGADSLREIKKDPVLQRLPVIIFTTTSNPQTVNQMYAMGARYFIEKPTDFGILKSVIGTVMETDIAASPGDKKDFTKFLQ